MPAGPDQPDVVWAGTEPLGAVARPPTAAAAFELVRGLWDHPHRPQWEAGFGGQAVHTVLPHPRRPGPDAGRHVHRRGLPHRRTAAASWAPGNTGIRAYFMPDEWPEFGQCVHKVARDAGNPERLYAQNHHGVYRSDDDGRTWSSIADGLPSDFGFPMVAHPAARAAWCGPSRWWPTASGSRPTHRCRVLPHRRRRRQAGSRCRWGCPRARSIRRCCATRCAPTTPTPGGVYFGTRSGEVYASRDEGDSWSHWSPRTCPTCSASAPRTV